MEKGEGGMMTQRVIQRPRKEKRFEGGMTKIEVSFSYNKTAN
jgi:hypothetical protein